MIRKAFLSLPVLLAMCWPAWGDIVVSIPDVEIPYTATSASFTLEAQFIGSYDMDSYELEVELAPQGAYSAVTFSDAAATSSNYIFDDPTDFWPEDKDIADTYAWVSNSTNAPPENRTDVTKDLVTVQLDVSGANIGETYLLSFDTNWTQMSIIFDDEVVNVGEVDWTDTGTITIGIPEPGSVTMLLGLAITSLILYRRRRKRS